MKKITILLLITGLLFLTVGCSKNKVELKIGKFE